MAGDILILWFERPEQVMSPLFLCVDFRFKNFKRIFHSVLFDSPFFSLNANKCGPKASILHF